MSKDLVKYKESIFLKIKRCFSNFFFKKRFKKENLNVDNNIKPLKSNRDFSKDILVKENKEEKRLKNLKLLYDNKKIDEKEISDDDIDKLIEMYDIEIQKLSDDTEIRKRNISNLMKSYKS